MGTDADSRSRGRESLGTAVKDEEIAKWIREGWSFRIKTVRGKDYITRRKGGMERSLGAYEDELWKRIMSLEKKAGRGPRFETGVFEEIEAVKEEVNKLSTRLEGLSCLLPETVHGKKWWLFTKIGTLTRQVAALKRQHRELEENQGKHESWTRDWIDALNQMRRELSESVNRRLRSDRLGCKHLDNEGVCTHWYWNLQTGWLQPMKEDRHQGRTVYRVRVREHTFICASCPSYEPRGKG